MQLIKLIERLAKYVLAVLAAAVFWRPNRARTARNALLAPRRILLVRIDNRIGEALLSTPLFTTLKTLRPLPEVDVLVHPAVARVLQDHPDLDKVLPLNRAFASLGPSLAEIRALRSSMNASQSLFATYLNVSPNAVRSWEQGTRRPRQAALKLLTIAKKNPKALLVA